MTAAPTTIIASPRKLNSGAWGVSVPAGTPVGARVTVRTSAGKEWTAEIVSIVQTVGSVSICESRSLDARPASAAAPRAYTSGYGGGYGRRRACRTGGNCSSFGSGRNCGGHDCDGY